MSLAIFPSVTTGITAATGSSQATGVVLTSRVNVIAVCATGGDAVTLPAGCGVGAEMLVRNNGAASADVFPPVGGAFNGGSTDAAVAVASAKASTFICTSSNGLTWVSLAGA
jgi:hypothetical protein